MSWLRNKLSLVETYPDPRPSERDDFEMAIRVDEALAAASAAALLAAAHTEEASKLFGTIRREIHNAKRAGAAGEGT